MTAARGKVLIIAGSDSGGGAGIQADIKAVTCLGGFAMTAITALTAQNTLGVTGIHDVPAAFVAEQITVVLEDLGADAIKIGMLHRTDIITVVAERLRTLAPDVPVVVDPVMVAKGGHALINDDAVDALKQDILPLATVITPNLPEAERLVGQTFDAVGPDAMAKALGQLGPEAVLVKGGHSEGSEVTDRLFAGGEGVLTLSSTRIETVHTHGTGCTLASALACGLAQGLDLEEAFRRARAYVIEAIATAPGFGGGHGPLNHGITVSNYAGHS
ncbi:MAG: bifunctional hydroxymethylpyrimidine kinase/phosphomethylpyrimidine kinase [Magnetovibrionaceae bacterium]